MCGWDSSLGDLPLCPCRCPLALIWPTQKPAEEKVEMMEKRNLRSRCSKCSDVCHTWVRNVPTWQVVKGLMLQSNCGTSWMDTWRLKALPLNSMVLGSSSSRPPLPRSPTATSWWQTEMADGLVRNSGKERQKGSNTSQLSRLMGDSQRSQNYILTN